MNQARAFSDTEIVTIATVAASALGGIVVGLGRGQDNGPDNETQRRGGRNALTRAARASSENASSLPVRGMPVDLGQLREMLDDVRPTKRKLLKRAAVTLLLRPALDAARNRMPSKPNVSETAFRDALKRAGETLASIAPERGSGRDFNELGDQLMSLLTTLTSSQNASNVDDEPKDGLITRIATDLESLEPDIPAVTATVKDIPERTRKVVRRRVTSPLAHAAGTTSNATKESLAALIWLSIGASIVYFGLLSDERREQVKASFCGAIEQVRLLLLDLQGYEPEM